MSTQERLLQSLGPVFETLLDGEEAPILIGGLAVHLQIERMLPEEDAFDEDLLPESDPLVLVRRGRVTKDIDLGVRSGARARELLRPRGFEGSEYTVTDGETRVDFLPYVTGVEKHQHACRAMASLSKAYDELSHDGVHLRVARPALLVVLKAISWRDRGEQRDLADLARLALADWSARRVARELAGLLGKLPQDLRSEVLDIRALYEGHPSSGASAFLEAEMKRRPLFDDEFEDAREDERCITVNQAVERLFAFVET